MRIGLEKTVLEVFVELQFAWMEPKVDDQLLSIGIVDFTSQFFRDYRSRSRLLSAHCALQWVRRAVHAGQ